VAGLPPDLNAGPRQVPARARLRCRRLHTRLHSPDDAARRRQAVASDPRGSSPWTEPEVAASGRLAVRPASNHNGASH
jgi:hypothetical protein